MAHRDIKFENLLYNEDLSLKIADFGISHFFGPDETDMTKDVQGTHYFLPPEAHSSEAFSSKAQDVWALGCVLYSMVTGDVPFKHPVIAQLIKLIKQW